MEIQSGNRIIRVSTEHLPTHEAIRQRFDLYFEAVEPKKENGYFVADFSKPSLHTLRSNGLQFLISDLPEETETRAAYQEHLPARRKLAFDIGAYCGVSTYELSMKFERVVAFEPDPLNLECLRSNIDRHELDNVTVVPFAMAATSGTGVFYAEGSQGSRL